MPELTFRFLDNNMFEFRLDWWQSSFSFPSQNFAWDRTIILEHFNLIISCNPVYQMRWTLPLVKRWLFNSLVSQGYFSLCPWNTWVSLSLPSGGDRVGGWGQGGTGQRVTHLGNLSQSFRNWVALACNLLMIKWLYLLTERWKSDQMS